MREYRITKYYPQNREEGIYIVHEWTSIGDIGKVFDNGVLTYSQYKKVEEAYINCCITLIQEIGVLELAVCCPEYYSLELRFPPTVSKENDIRGIIMSCLQEKCWVKLEAQNFFIHFGYDYCMYIGTDLSFSVVEKIAQENKLFCEMIPSPYKD